MGVPNILMETLPSFPCIYPKTDARKCPPWSTHIWGAWEYGEHVERLKEKKHEDRIDEKLKLVL